MAFVIQDPILDLPAIGTPRTSLLSSVNLGMMVRAIDGTLGGGEFIYLLGVANTKVGSLVTYNASTFQTAIAPVHTSGNTDNPIAVAMSANPGSSYDFYQVGGVATILKDAVTVNPQVSLYLGANAGRVKVLASSGIQILGARSANLTTVTSTTSTLLVTISRPFTQGQIT